MEFELKTSYQIAALRNLAVLDVAGVALVVVGVCVAMVVDDALVGSDVAVISDTVGFSAIVCVSDDIFRG